MNHQFFQMFTGQAPQQERINTTQQLQNNEIVLEICNNWEFVREMFFKMMTEGLSAVDPLETTWVSFINSNNIDMRNYKTPEEFEQKHLRALAE